MAAIAMVFGALPACGTESADPSPIVDLADSTPHPPNDAADSSPQPSLDAADSGSFSFEINDSGKATCSPACPSGLACSFAHTCLGASTCPAGDVGISCTAGVVGSWIANGKDKINKLEKIVLCVHKNVTAKIFDANGKLHLTVQNVFCQQTNLNALLAPGLYYAEFYDAGGNVIVTPDDVHEDLVIE